MKMLVTFFLLCLPVQVLSAGDTWAGPPTDALHPPMDAAFKILSDPRYKDADAALKQEQRQRLWQEINPIFDFTEVSKRALARNWLDFSLEQRRQFRDAFSELLGNLYLSKIQGAFRGQEVVFSGEETVTAEKAVVQTKILLQNGAMPVDYYMKTAKEGWRVYDVNVEGVSLIKNYRSQFNEILVNDPPEKLIKMLQDKVARIKKGEAVE